MQPFSIFFFFNFFFYVFGITKWDYLLGYYLEGSYLWISLNVSSRDGPIWGAYLGNTANSFGRCCIIVKFSLRSFSYCTGNDNCSIVLYLFNFATKKFIVWLVIYNITHSNQDVA